VYARERVRERERTTVQNTNVREALLQDGLALSKRKRERERKKSIHGA
jgi:hypothetical protein